MPRNNTFPVLRILLSIKAFLPPRLEKNITSALSPSHYQAENKILKNN